jgi:hypothetical protein
MKKILVFALVISFFTSCSNDKKEDIVQEVPKNGTIESSVKVEHLNDSMDILVTEHKVWQNANSLKNLIARDTIPSLGMTTVNDENGNKKQVKKDYDIYITVK